ncbi:hypothetical protein [Acidithrix sp. C25]|uniref:hypothetical protein n=1 Tax=Acidithrix sp. C25 TaxID=1671482 RepID=UPI00191BBD40|nr:hypothetical protein [Acidithrix sp. C25]CAG4926564.1 unnamed protein product [Acidithrix sp. C25]
MESLRQYVDGLFLVIGGVGLWRYANRTPLSTIELRTIELRTIEGGSSSCAKEIELS